MNRHIVIVSGQVRTFLHCIDSMFNHLIFKYKEDVDEIDVLFRLKLNNSKNHWLGMKYSDASRKSVADAIEKYRSTVSQIKVVILDDDEISDEQLIARMKAPHTFTGSTNHLSQMLHNHYNMERCWKLIDNPEQYASCVYIRADSYFFRNVCPWSRFNKNLITCFHNHMMIVPKVHMESFFTNIWHFHENNDSIEWICAEHALKHSIDSISVFVKKRDIHKYLYVLRETLGKYSLFPRRKLFKHTSNLKKWCLKQNPAAKEKVCIVVRGESFRSGGQHSREIGQNYHPQVQAIQTHLHHIEQLKQFFDVEIHLYTYKSIYSDKLKCLYSQNGNTVHCTLLEQQDFTQQTLWKLAIANVSSLSFDYILVFRFDMHFYYSNLVDTIVHHKHNHCQLFGMSRHGKLRKNGSSPPADTFHWIPLNYVNLYRNFPAHTRISNVHYLYNIISDADSSKISNPIYHLYSRPISTLQWIDLNYPFIATFNSVKNTLYLKRISKDINKSIRFKKKIVCIFKNQNGIHTVHGIDILGHDTVCYKCSCVEYAKEMFSNAIL